MADKTVSFGKGTMKPVEVPAEYVSLSLPFFVTICILGALTFVSVGIVILCCCRRGRNRKKSSASTDVILSSKLSSPTYVETEVQREESDNINPDVPPPAMRVKQNSLGGVPASLLMFRRNSSMSTFEILPNEVDVDMYSGNESGTDDPRSPSVHGLGKLCFSMAYDNNSETLSLTLSKAFALSPKGSKATADPYVKLVLLPDKKPKYVSKILRKSLNPVFDETFPFAVKKENLMDKSLKLTVCDYDRFSRQVVIGYVSVELKQVDFAATPWTGDIWRDICDGSAGFRYRGQILFSLSFDPGMGAIRVGILKAKELQAPESDKLEGVYVKVGLLMNEKLVKSKKTKTPKKSPSPIFNDEFAFHIHPSLICDVSIMVSVHTRNAFGKSGLLGKTTAGPFVHTSGQGLAHWNDMLAAPKSAVAQWHVL